MYTHRPLLEEDLIKICTWPQSSEELLYVSPRFTYPLTPEQIITMLTNRFEPTVVIEIESGQPVAYANLYDESKSDRHCWLGNVIVSPAHRGKGVAEVLLNTMMFNAKQKYEMKKLLLSCHNTNSRGLAFYDKHRFRPFDLRITKLEDDRRLITIQMEKEL
ncbi:GNAT family N-acetyltransferase [Paenibacillus sp. EC2-1]|uniref:GNAT family N-acetyltransferase n=1 Tax=Paenibacillus sp. EC2-1 TaxID=3388665 RepID=UPI003BEF496E